MKPIGKQVQVPESVLADILRLSFYLDEYDIGDGAREALDRLVAVVDSKIEARERREAFTAYKTAADGREEARQRYLDIVGINKDWRTSKETTCP